MLAGGPNLPAARLAQRQPDFRLIGDDDSGLAKSNLEHAEEYLITLKALTVRTRAPFANGHGSRGNSVRGDDGQRTGQVAATAEGGLDGACRRPSSHPLTAPPRRRNQPAHQGPAPPGQPKPWASQQPRPAPNPRY